MTTFDLSPLFRSTVGYDRLSRAFETALSLGEAAFAYPPYNIEKTGDSTYRISMAVAGFTETDLEIITQEDMVLVRGKGRPETADALYLYRGIAGRAFERKFQLADFIRVSEARLENGLLHIDLVREVPEALRPRKVEIAAPGPSGSANVTLPKAA